MKRSNQIARLSVRVIIISCLLSLSIAPLGAQNHDNTTSKSSARISLEYTVFNNIEVRLSATIKTRVEKSYVAVPDVAVNFYLDEVAEENNMGSVISNSEGQAVLIISEKWRNILAGRNDFTFLAVIEDDKRFKDEATEIEIKRSFSELTLEEKDDSVKEVRLFVGAPDSSDMVIPQEEVEAIIYVQRLFGLLPISEEFESTGEDGYLVIEFPNDIPGGKDGELTIIAKVKDHEEFGNLVSSQKINWGIPLQDDAQIERRELWSARANAPLSLVLISISLIVGIWGIIGYVIFQLIRIKKIGARELNL